MTMERSDYTARDYEREAQTARRRLADDLAELSDRLTPGQVFDEVLSYARGGSGTFLRALSNAARENPVPSLLIGAGCMLFLSEKMGLNQRLSSAATGAIGNGMRRSAASSRGMAERVRSGVGEAADFVGEQASSVAGSVAGGIRRGARSAGETMEAAADRARRTAQDVRDQVTDAADAAMERARYAGDAAMERARYAGEAAMEGARHAGGAVTDYASAIGGQVAEAASAGAHRAREVASQVRQSTTNLAHEQPLLVAAVGLAVGAVIAAALPRTQTEDEYMGEASDALKRAASDVATEQYDQAKKAAGRVLEETRNVAEQEGLTPSAAAEAVRNLGNKVASVANQTSESAQAEAKDLMTSRSSGS